MKCCVGGQQCNGSISPRMRLFKHGGSLFSPNVVKVMIQSVLQWCSGLHNDTIMTAIRKKPSWIEKHFVFVMLRRQSWIETVRKDSSKQKYCCDRAIFHEASQNLLKWTEHKLSPFHNLRNTRITYDSFVSFSCHTEQNIIWGLVFRVFVEWTRVQNSAYYVYLFIIFWRRWQIKHESQAAHSQTSAINISALMQSDRWAHSTFTPSVMFP